MKLFFSLFILVIAIGAKAQSFNISADKMNVAYIGIPNPLTIVADNATCKELIVTVGNGTIQKKDSCHFYFLPEKEGKVAITIQKKTKGKLVTIGKQELRAKLMPDPHVMVANKSSGPISLSVFKKQQGLIIGWDEYSGLDWKFSVVSFRITILYPIGEYEEDVIGNRFTAQTILQFNKLRVSDRVLIDHIKAIGPDHMIRAINGMMFTMKQ